MYSMLNSATLLSKMDVCVHSAVIILFDEEWRWEKRSMVFSGFCSMRPVLSGAAAQFH